MKEIINYISLSGLCLGVLYFLIRFFYFSVKNNIELEIKNITSFHYFLTIKKENINTDTDLKVSIFLNIILRVFYYLFVMTFIMSFISVLINEFK